MLDEILISNYKYKKKLKQLLNNCYDLCEFVIVSNQIFTFSIELHSI